MLEYDFIIVGAGTAGCLVARRLADKHPKLSILILEAGEDRSSDERIFTPGLAGQLRGNNDFDWRYETTPQPGLNGRRLSCPRGKCVGGSSAINSFALIYPNNAGIDVWAELGNEGWDWEGLRDEFRTFQTIHPSDSTLPVVSPGDASTSGCIVASMPTEGNFLHPLQIAWIETFRGLGMENTADPLDGQALGGYISTCHITGDTRERSHAGSFLGPSNIHLVTGAVIEKVSFLAGTKPLVAESVKYIKGGDTVVVKAREEVILAAGAIASPQLLELSGIGNPRILEEHGIDLSYRNDYVGENLQDHIRAGISFEAIPGIERRDPDPQKWKKQYEESRQGPMAENACWTFAQLPLRPFLDEDARRDLEAKLDAYVLQPGLSRFERIRNSYIRRITLSEKEASATVYLSRLPAVPPSEGQPTRYVGLFAMLGHPFSRGSVHVSGKGADRKPFIDFQYYGQDLDLEINARQLQALASVAQAAPLKDFIQPGGQILPAIGDVANLEDAKEMCRQYSGTNYHPCGSCSMLPEEDGGVVNSRLRVYGTTNLRVVDASVIPIIPRGNIITTVYAVAEKAAKIISEDWTKAAHRA